MSYKKDDFSNLPWNPFDNPTGVKKLYPPLTLYKEFSLDLLGTDKDLFYNFMVMNYHRESILVKDYDVIKDRKEKALEILDVDKNKSDKWPVNIERIINGSNDAANKMILRFCTLQNSQKYSLLCAMGTNYDRILFRLSEEANITDINEAVTLSAKSFQELEKMSAQIDKLKKEVFSGDMKAADEADNDFISYSRVAGYPELIMVGKEKIPDVD